MLHFNNITYPAEATLLQDLFYAICIYISLYSYIRLPSLFAKCYLKQQTKDYIVAGILCFFIWIQFTFITERVLKHKGVYLYWLIFIVLYPYLYSGYLRHYHDEDVRKKRLFLSLVVLLNILLWFFLTDIYFG